jgi:hypothetical protein
LETRHKHWITSAAIVSVVVLLIVGISLLTNPVERSEPFKRLMRADRAVVYRANSSGFTLTYTGDELRQILDIILYSQRDNGVYDTPIGLFLIDFYEGESKIDALPTCSNLFRIGGRQYRACDHALSVFVDDALETAQNRLRSD